MAAVQMNLRIDSRVKEQGDAALGEAGYSPTQAVRALWTFAATHAHEPQVVRDLLRQVEGERDLEREERIAAKRAALARVDDLRKQLEGVVGPLYTQGVEPLSYKELRDEALAEHWQERGLI